jgi:NAD(P)H-dependent FMN reductase
MTRTVTVVALVGSLRDRSKTRVACRTALEAAADAGAETELVDLPEYDLPLDDAGETDAGDAAELRRVVREADAVLLGTPNYRGSYSSTLKTARDYCGRDELAGATVGLLEVAGGSFPTRPLEHLRVVCRRLNAWTPPTEVGIPDSRSTVRDGVIVDDAVEGRVRRLGTELVAYAGVDRYPEVSAPVEAPPEAHADCRPNREQSAARNVSRSRVLVVRSSAHRPPPGDNSASVAALRSSQVLSRALSTVDTLCERRTSSTPSGRPSERRTARSATRTRRTWPPSRCSRWRSATASPVSRPSRTSSTVA